MRFWCPTGLELPSGEKLDFPLLPTQKEFNYANSVGLAYEAEEVRRCLKEGLTESPGLSLDESLSIARVMESIRKQVGVNYPQDE
jgi:dihydrodiol dehydrogenase / D-xylose 1-dehydrogenase (NADP)